MSKFTYTFSNINNIDQSNKPRNIVSGNTPEKNATVNHQNGLITTPRNITGTPVQNNVSQNLQNNIRLNPKNIELENGFLQIQTLDIVERRNLVGANVTILTENEDKVLYELLTDANGLTKVVALPAPALKYSLDIKSLIVPYFTYTVKIKHTEYSSIIYKGVQVFAGTTSLQICYLTLLPEDIVIRKLPPGVILKK